MPVDAAGGKLPYDDLLAAALLVYFGVKTLQARRGRGPAAGGRREAGQGSARGARGCVRWRGGGRRLGGGAGPGSWVACAGAARAGGGGRTSGWLDWLQLLDGATHPSHPGLPTPSACVSNVMPALLG